MLLQQKVDNNCWMDVGCDQADSMIPQELFDFNPVSARPAIIEHLCKMNCMGVYRFVYGDAGEMHTPIFEIRSQTRTVIIDAQGQEIEQLPKLTVYPEAQMIIFHGQAHQLPYYDAVGLLSILIAAEGRLVSAVGGTKTRVKPQRVKGYLQRQGLVEVAELIIVRYQLNQQKEDNYGGTGAG